MCVLFDDGEVVLFIGINGAVLTVRFVSTPLAFDVVLASRLSPFKLLMSFVDANLLVSFDVFVNELLLKTETTKKMLLPGTD